MKRPTCKCGNACAYYGPVGGYSVACEQCNAKNAARQRAARAGAGLKAEREREINYEAVLDDLRARRNRVVAAIASIEALTQPLSQ